MHCLGTSPRTLLTRKQHKQKDNHAQIKQQHLGDVNLRVGYGGQRLFQTAELLASVRNPMWWLWTHWLGGLLSL